MGFGDGRDADCGLIEWFFMHTKIGIEKMLVNCSRGDLLGQHSAEKEKKVYRQLMQLIHPDKTRDLGKITLLILEELVKAVNNRYHPT